MYTSDAQMECKDEKKSDTADSEVKDSESVAVVRCTDNFQHCL